MTDFAALAAQSGGSEAGPQDYAALAAKSGGVATSRPPAAPTLADAMRQTPMGQMGDTAASVASGAVAGPLSGLAGLAGAALPGPEGQGADWVRKTQEALTFEPKTRLGKLVTSVLSYPGEKLAQLGDAAGTRTADAAGPLAGAAVNTAIQAIPFALGGIASKMGRGEVAAPVAQDATVAAARDSGYVVPPTQANPSLVNKVLEGAAGKIKLGQTLSETNQPVSNRLVRETFGIPETEKLTPERLGEVRKEAGKAYQAVRDAGRVTPGESYTAALDALAEPYLNTSKDFPLAKKTDVLDVIDSMRVPSFDASSGVDQIRIMRGDADKAYAGRDKALGAAYRGVADALESAIDEHLTAVGAPADVLQNFRDARRTIAETYTVQKHLNASGNIDTQGLARELKKKPLEGNLKTVAEFGANFPKAAQMPEKIGGVPMSPLDAGFALLSGVAGAAATGNAAGAAMAAAPLGRLGVRKMLSSPGYQDAFVGAPTPGPTMAARLLDAQENPATSLFEVAQGQREHRPLTLADMLRGLAIQRPQPTQ